MSHKPPRTYNSWGDPTHKGGTAPLHAHLALQQGEGIAGLVPIPPGAHLFIIEDPAKANTIYELILEKVVFENHHPVELRFWTKTKEMVNPRRMRMVISWEGKYESPLAAPSEAAAQELDKRGGK